MPTLPPRIAYVCTVSGYNQPELEACLLHRPKEELYDLGKDPNETRNLATDSAMAEVLAGFRKELKEWQETTRDPWLIKYTHE